MNFCVRNVDCSGEVLLLFLTFPSRAERVLKNNLSHGKGFILTQHKSDPLNYTLNPLPEEAKTSGKVPNNHKHAFLLNTFL